MFICYNLLSRIQWLFFKILLLLNHLEAIVYDDHGNCISLLKRVYLYSISYQDCYFYLVQSVSLQLISFVRDIIIYYVYHSYIYLFIIGPNLQTISSKLRLSESMVHRTLFIIDV